MSYKFTIKRFGGEGSGNFGHEGRPGEVGGSGEGRGGDKDQLISELKEDMTSDAYASRINKLEFFHGTNNEEVFEEGLEPSVDEVNDYPGISLSTDKTYAKGYGDILASVKVSTDSVLKVDNEFWEGSSKNIEHKQIYDLFDKTYGKAVSKDIGKLTAVIKKAGHDGWFTVKRNEVAELRVFFQGNIKGLIRINSNNLKSTLQQQKQVLTQGGPGSGNFGHEGRPGEVGGSGEEREDIKYSDPTFEKASVEIAAKLNEEWANTYTNEPEGPFWNVEGEKNGKYWVVRNEDGILVAGATTIQKGMSTEILSIASHALGQGTTILDALKGRNIFLIALASSDKSKQWFVKNGFKEVLDKPGQYNVRWKKLKQKPPLTQGGPGSGNFGHAGRPGEVGGSGDGNESVEVEESREELAERIWENMDLVEFNPSKEEKIKESLKDIYSTATALDEDSIDVTVMEKYDERSHVNGTYSPLKRIITMGSTKETSIMSPQLNLKTKGIPEFKVGGDFQSTFRHEYGHAVYSQFLRVSQQKSWEDFYKENKGLFSQVSGYALTNYSEGFAEVFSAVTSPLYGTKLTPTIERQLPAEIETMMHKLIKK